MQNNTNQTEKIQKRIILTLILGIIAIGLIGFYAFSKYITSVEGQGEAQIAKWSFIVNGQTNAEEEIDLNLTINPNNNVASGRVAPGTSGSFEIEIDATKSEVALSYAIEMDLEKTPQNLKLYSEYADGEYKNPITVENKTATIKGYMSLDDIKTVKTKTIYWDWPYETPTPKGQEKSNDEIDTEDSGKPMKIGVTVTGTEQLEPQVYAKDVLKPDATKELKTPYVNYYAHEDDDEPILCRVLYNDEEHGLQIITEGSVENVGLGTADANYSGISSNLEKAQNSYKNAIENLNNKAESYINNNLVEDARCVGSIPTVTEEEFDSKDKRMPLTKPSETGYDYLNDYIAQTYPGTDNNYNSDFNQMQTLGIRAITTGTVKTYWLASHFVSFYSYIADFNMRFVLSSGNLYYDSLLDKDGSTGNPSYGFRPVFLLKSNVEIIDGDGTSAHPYELGIN